MAEKKRILLPGQNPGSTEPGSPVGPGQARSDVRELRVGRRSLRDAVLLLARKMEELGVDVSDVTEMLGVTTFASIPKAEAIDPDIFERDTVDMTRPVRKPGKS
jgi:hypothetical protein